ncbi:unnamed protein product, partial [Meganyctiphanes norvegica]
QAAPRAPGPSPVGYVTSTLPIYHHMQLLGLVLSIRRSQTATMASLKYFLAIAMIVACAGGLVLPQRQSSHNISHSSLLSMNSNGIYRSDQLHLRTHNSGSLEVSASVRVRRAASPMSGRYDGSHRSAPVPSRYDGSHRSAPSRYVGSHRSSPSSYKGTHRSAPSRYDGSHRSPPYFWGARQNRHRA